MKTISISRMKFLVLCLLNFFSSSFAQTSIPAGNVSGTWTIGGSPYLIQGNIQIPNDSSLTIEAGVTVEFQGHYKFNVLGRIVASGTVTDTITFTIRPDSIVSGWWGFRFDSISSTQDSSLFNFCKIQYGKANGTAPENQGGAIYLNSFSKFRISNSRIFNNSAVGGGGAIYCYLSSPIITGNIINDNSTASAPGGGIYCNTSSPVISNNVINNNIGTGGGGIFIYTNSIPDIRDNIISNNTSEEGGGIYCYSSSPTLINNIISNNTATGFISAGGGIFCFSSSPKIYNCTITNNTSTSTSAGGGGLSCANTSNPILKNTIIWGNTASNGNGANVELKGNQSDPTFIYCNVQGDSMGFFTNGTTYTGIYTNNIDIDPLFVSASAGAGAGFNGLMADWSLQNISPCINTGTPDTTGLSLPSTDISGNSRIVSCYIDMGAYENQNSLPFSFDISGTVLKSDSTTQIVSGKVYLIEYINIAARFAFIDSFPLNGISGNYSFANISCGGYLIFVKPDESAYPNTIPAYFGDTIFWNGATVLTLSSDTVGIDIRVKEIPPLTGSGSIGGYIQYGIGSGKTNNGNVIPFGDPVPGIDVSLEQIPGGIKDHAQTDNNGFYSFSNLPVNSTYKLYIDIAGLPMDSTYTVNVTASDTVINALDYVIDTTSGGTAGIYIGYPLSISDSEINSGFKIYPNPSDGKFSIELKNEKNFSVIIYNCIGEKIQEEYVKNSFGEINIYEYENGIYFLRINSNSSNHFIKTIINK